MFDWCTLAYYAIAVIIIAVAIWLLTKFYRFFLQSRYFGHTHTVRILNIATCAIVFRGAMSNLLTRPVITVVNMISSFTYDASDIAQAGQSMQPSKLWFYTGQLLEPLKRLFQYDLTDLRILFALAFCGMLTYVANKVFYNKEEQRYVSDKPGHYSFQQNLLLGFLLAASLFLVLSAMIAIPYNSPDRSATASQNQPMDSSSFSIRYADTIGKAASLPDMVLLNGSFAIFSDLKKPDLKNLAANQQIRVADYFNRTASVLADEIDHYNRNVEGFIKYQKTKALDFQRIIHSSTLKRKLLQTHAQNLSYFFNTGVDYSAGRLENQKHSLDENIALVKDAYAEFFRQLTGFSEALHLADADTATAVKTPVPQNPFQSVYYNNPYPAENISYEQNLEDVPKEPDAGSDWGLLGGASGWLIMSESTDLTLIVGMFGFGLLGAAISSFITTKKEDLENPATPLLENLSIVVIRGFSAAIVIFLATKGSIAIVNSGTNEPNPYVLFFTCLVGAVFSEPIWEWARKEIRSRFPPATPAPKGGGNKGDNGGNDGEDAGDAGEDAGDAGDGDEDAGDAGEDAGDAGDGDEDAGDAGDGDEDAGDAGDTAEEPATDAGADTTLQNTAQQNEPPASESRAGAGEQ